MRRLVTAGVICLWAQAAWAEGVRIEVSDNGAASDETSTALDTPAESASAEGVEAAALPESYTGKLDYGHGLYLRGDYAEALAAYTAAKDSRTADPLPLYFIACAQAKLGNLDEARTALSALKTVCGERLPGLHARGLFLAAVIEEMGGDLAASAEAWAAYKSFAAAHSSVPTFVASADARSAAIEKVRTLDEQYQVVRERISGGE